MAAWFWSTCLGMPLDGLSTADTVWDDLREVSHGRANTDFVILGRTSARIEIAKWLNDSSGDVPLIKIGGASFCEISDFFAATIHLEQDPRLASKALIIDDGAAAKSLSCLTSDHVILTCGAAVPTVMRKCGQIGCRAAFAYMPSTDLAPWPTIKDYIRIPSCGKCEMIEAVQRAGYSAEQAAKLCRDNSYDYARVRQAVYGY